MKSGKLKLRPWPNIHLLYTEMDSENKYQPQMETAVVDLGLSMAECGVCGGGFLGTQDESELGKNGKHRAIRRSGEDCLLLSCRIGEKMRWLVDARSRIRDFTLVFQLQYCLSCLDVQEVV